MKTLVFDAIDTLFFRESRPMDALGEAQSIFPPPVRTLAGAVRTLVGEHFKVRWHEFNQKQGEHPLATHIGDSESLGRLRFQGAWLALAGQRLYPAPLHLLVKDNKLSGQLRLSKHTTWCDLGKNVRLPELPSAEAKGSKPLENAWLTVQGLTAVLQGKLPEDTDIKKASELFQRESRLGIARNNATRSVQQGLLYQTQHIRPHPELSIELDVQGLPTEMPTQAIVRLGGEGRTASLYAKQPSNAFPPAEVSGSTFALYLLTPLYAPAHLGLQRQQHGVTTVWRGTLNGIALTLHGAITGKAQRVGGWDAAANKPRPVKSLVPAGSVFFCSVDNGDIAAVLAALHNRHIGDFTEYGYGHLAVGIWNDDETSGMTA